MPGSAQPWDLPEDPREQTVDLPRIDLASYANGEAGHRDTAGPSRYPDGGPAANGRSYPPAGPPTGPEPRRSSEPRRNGEPHPGSEPHGRFLPDSSRDPYAWPSREAQPGSLLRPAPAPGAVAADPALPRPPTQAETLPPLVPARPAEPREEPLRPLAGPPDTPSAAPGPAMLPAPATAEPLAPLPAESLAPPPAEPVAQPPAEPPPLLAQLSVAPPAPAPPPAASSPLGERPDTAEQAQVAPPPRRRRESRDDGRPAAGSISDLRARLDRLPDGHPSSPYEDGGLARPLPHRLRQLELGLPAPERDHADAPREPLAGLAMPPALGETRTGADDRHSNRDAAQTVDASAPESAPALNAAAEPEPASAPTSEPHSPEGSNGDDRPSGRTAAWQDPYAIRAADGGSPDHRPPDSPALALGPWRASASADRPERRPPSRSGPNGHAGAGRADADRAITAQFRTSSLTHEQGQLVAELLAACRAAEGRNMFGDYDESGLTPVMRRIGAELARGGLAPGSEADALKSPERLAAKLARLIARHPGRSAEELAAGIGDGIRYAFTFDSDFYTEGTWHVHRRLKEQDFELEARRNRWDSPEYKGVWTRWRDPAHRLVFEVQFHTSASWEVVRRTHRAFVQITDPATPAPERARLRSRQVAAAAAAKEPPRWTEISDFGREAR